jgi:hypothetical protein
LAAGPVNNATTGLPVGFAPSNGPPADSEAVAPSDNQVSQGAQAAALSPQAGGADGDAHPFESTMSLWGNEQQLDVAVLPSAIGASSSSLEPVPDAIAERPPVNAGRGYGRKVFWALMGLAVVTLVGAIVYLAMDSSSSSDDPASVGMKEDEVIEAVPTVTAKASVAPKPAPRKYRPQKKKVSSDDVYDEL